MTAGQIHPARQSVPDSEKYAARAYLGILPDDIALWALPGSLLEAYCKEISALSRANPVLTRFHSARGKEVASGSRQTVRELLERM